MLFYVLNLLFSTTSKSLNYTLKSKAFTGLKTVHIQQELIQRVLKPSSQPSSK